MERGGSLGASAGAGAFGSSVTSIFSAIFYVTRKNIKPLSFGGGIHHCVGNQLARLETEIALTGLLQRFPNLKVTDPQNPQFRKSIALRGLTTLPATL